MRRLLALCLLTSLATAAKIDPYLVLPLHNLSGNPNLDWIGESVSEAVSETLTAFDVPVTGRRERDELARGLSLWLPGLLTKASVIKLAKEAGARHVVYGTFDFEPSESSGISPSGVLHLSAHSIDLERVAAGCEWEESGLLGDLSQLQSRFSWKVLEFAAPQDAPTETEFLEARPPIRIDARENYIRGLLAADLDEKHRFFTLAVNLEPDLSQASFELGRLHWEDNSYRAAATWLERVKPSDAHYLEANFLLGLCRYHAGDYLSARSAFELVAQSRPIADVHNNLGLVYCRLGNPGAIDNLRWAIGRKPDDPDLQFNTAYILWRQGDLAGAAEHFRLVLQLDPGDVDAGRMLERCLTGSGPRRGDLTAEGLERLKENIGVIGISRNGADSEIVER